MLAAILESGDPERLYTGLSLLVCTASAGEEARALIGFGALRALLDPDLAARATLIVDSEREPFARTLAELRDTALAMEGLRIWACAAAVETTGADRALVEARLAGVVSTPRFLREAAGAELVVL